MHRYSKQEAGSNARNLCEKSSLLRLPTILRPSGNPKRLPETAKHPEKDAPPLPSDGAIQASLAA